MAKRQTIAVDIDDVLSASAQGFADFSNNRWGTSLTAADYREEWAVVWGITVEQAIERSKDFHRAEAHASFAHIPEAVSVIEHLAERFELVAVTSRLKVVKPATDAWLARHFPGAFKEVRYAGMWDSKAAIEHKINATKTEICKELGAAYLIDDQIKHCVSAAGAGITAILFGDYPWNQVEYLPANVVRVHNWTQVMEYFDAQS